MRMGMLFTNFVFDHIIISHYIRKLIVDASQTPALAMVLLNPVPWMHTLVLAQEDPESKLFDSLRTRRTVFLG